MAGNNIFQKTLGKIDGLAIKLGHHAIEGTNKTGEMIPMVKGFTNWHESLGERGAGYSYGAALAAWGVAGPYLSAKKMQDPNSNKAMDVLGGFTEAKFYGLGVNAAGLGGIGLYNRFLRK
jgi:hypothetical protein